MPVAIARARVKSVTLSWPTAGGEPLLYLPFNCLDETGAPIPTLGGWIESKSLKPKKAWKDAGDALQQLMENTALSWVEAWDDFETTTSGFDMISVHLARYQLDGGKGRGVDFHYSRRDDTFPCHILFEHTSGADIMLYNQKYEITDPAIIAEIDAAIDAILLAADDLAFLVNSQRDLRRKGNRDGHSTPKMRTWRESDSALRVHRIEPVH
jgi:hypothetical protein